MARRTRVRGTVVLAAAAALTLTGCSIPGIGGDEAAGDGASSGRTTGDGGSGSGAKGEGTAQLAAEPSPGAAVEDLGVLASRDWEDDDSNARIDINELRVKGDYVRLVLTVTNTQEHDGYILPYEIFGYGDLGTALLQDPINSKRYLPAVTKDNRCICSNDLTSLQVYRGQSKVLYTTFQAPPPDVQKLDVEMPELGLINDIPVQR